MLKVYIKPLSRALWTSYCRGHCSLFQCTLNFGLGRQQSTGSSSRGRWLEGSLFFSPVLQVGWERWARFRLPFFVRVIKWHLQPLLPCQMFGSNQTPCGMMKWGYSCLCCLLFAVFSAALAPLVNKSFHFCQVASCMETFCRVQSSCLISGSSTQKDFLQAQCLSLVLLKILVYL